MERDIRGDLPTMRVRVKGYDGAEAVINRSSFDPSKHEEIKEDPHEAQPIQEETIPETSAVAPEEMAAMTTPFLRRLPEWERVADDVKREARNKSQIIKAILDVRGQTGPREGEGTT